MHGFHAIDGRLIVRGKTKALHRTDARGVVEVYSLDDLTAGNGKKHDILPGKGEWATTITCNMFEYLKKLDVPVAYIKRTGPRTFWALQCDMVKLEVVIRRTAEGSYLKRNPKVKQGTRLDDLVVEFYLKTNNKKWTLKDGRSVDLPEDDMYLAKGDHTFGVHHPAHPIHRLRALTCIPMDQLNINRSDVVYMETIGQRVFLFLEQAWAQISDGLLKDIKIEFGWYHDESMNGTMGVLLVADVIDNDSWRLHLAGEEVSKELYRKEAPLAEVAKAYAKVAQHSALFKDLTC